MLKRAPRPPAKRKEVDQSYIDRQREAGMTQVKVWVPEALSDWFHSIAAEARHATRTGAPLKLPDTIILQVRTAQ